MLGRRGQRGDTLIEVLFAITIFSLIVVTTLSIMNQGTAAARRSVEMTLVREQIDAQAEALRFLHEAYVAHYSPGIEYDRTGATSPAEEYAKIKQATINAARTNASAFGSATTCPTTTPSGGFLVNPRTARYVPRGANLVPATEGYAKLVFTGGNATVQGQGIWIESVRSDVEAAPSVTSSAGYIDFYIRACWYAPGTDTPLTMGTIVRLYEPRG